MVDNRQLVCKKEKKKEIKKALSNFFETTSSGPFLLEKEGRKTRWEFLLAGSIVARTVRESGNAFLDLPSVELINQVSRVPSSDGTWFIAAT